jgi:hypothetical protein
MIAQAPAGGKPGGAAVLNAGNVALVPENSDVRQVVSFADYYRARNRRLIVEAAERFCPARRDGWRCPWCRQ